MSERFPIGAQVRVKNDGHGSQFRSESERVGEFAGTVVAVNGPKYTGIPEVCVESVTGERRVILVGDLEEGVAATEPTTPRPAMKRINVTAKMADALGITIEINGKQAMIMSHPKSQASLVPRGLADENGYLTDQGRFVAHLISLGTKDRAWSWDTIEAGTRTWLSDQKRHAETAPTLEDIELDSDAADREEARREESTVECECGAQWPTGVMGEGHNDTDCTTASQRKTPEVTEYSVKIWYRSGAYEGAPHCLEDLARKIYADAVKSPGVEFAELHGPSGVLVESKVPADDRDAVSDTLVMRPSPEWRPVLVTETLIRRCCFCQGDKQVHHHTALAMPVCHDCAVFVSA